MTPLPFADIASRVETDFIVLDLCECRLSEVFRRPWVASGVIPIPLAEGKSDVEGHLTRLASDSPGPLIVVRREAMAFDTTLLDQLDAFPLDRLIWVDVDEAGTALSDRQALLARTIPPQAWALTITAEDHRRMTVDGLPVAMDVASQSADPRTWLLAVEGTAPLPQRTWFQLPAPGRGRLGLAIRPGRDGDRWQAWLSGDGSPSPALQIPGDPLGNRPFRLTVILDRTCVDHNHWEAARRLHSTVIREFCPDMSTWNADLRRRIALALAELPDIADFDVWWFADLPGDGLAWPGPWPGPDRAFGTAGRWPGSSLPGALAGLGWVPGLDVWDALDLALEGVVAGIDSSQASRNAVLIIGNSPPAPPLQPSAAWRDAVAAAGAAPAVRRRGRWSETVEHGLAMGIPMAMVQLPAIPPDRHGAGADRLRQNHALTRNAMEGDGLRVFGTGGSEADLGPVIQAAAEWLRRRVVSSIQVRP